MEQFGSHQGYFIILHVIGWTVFRFLLTLILSAYWNERDWYFFLGRQFLNISPQLPNIGTCMVIPMFDIKFDNIILKFNMYLNLPSQWSQKGFLVITLCSAARHQFQAISLVLSWSCLSALYKCTIYTPQPTQPNNLYSWLESCAAMQKASSFFLQKILFGRLVACI